MHGTCSPLAHVISLLQQAPLDSGSAGSITQIVEGPPLASGNLMLRRIVVLEHALRDPEWHLDASEIGYCVGGAALVTIVDRRGVRDCFQIEAGDMFFFPPGAAHLIENVGTIDVEIILASAIRGEHPAGQGDEASTALKFGSDISRAAARRLTPEETISLLANVGEVERPTRFRNPYRFAIDHDDPPILAVFGSTSFGEQNMHRFPNELAMFSMRVTSSGVREPHWHPETFEFGYVVEGRGAITIVDPEGRSIGYRLEAGDVYFVPKGHSHQVENLTGETLHVLAFFDKSSRAAFGCQPLDAAFARDLVEAEFWSSDRHHTERQAAWG